MVRVRLFAAPREAVGASEIDVPLAGSATATEILAAAVRLHPALAPYSRSLRVAVNRRFAGPGDRVEPSDEVALLPPVSGGSVAFAEDLDLSRIVEESTRAGAGAVVGFLGLARPDGGTTSLEFEAYREMALSELRAIEDASRAKWGLLDVAIRHRLGAVPVGEPAILVVVVAKHRREAFEAASWIMDRVKEDVPVWKKENGRTPRWVHPERTGRAP